MTLVTTVLGVGELDPGSPSNGAGMKHARGLEGTPGNIPKGQPRPEPWVLPPPNN